MKKQVRKEHKINQEIKVSEVRLVGEGIVSNVYPLNEALAIAESKEMDLVLINESSNPPVAKVMKYEKYLYELSKKPKQKILDVKEIRLTPNTGDNDLEYRTKHIIDFLEKGHKVKISLKFKGREIVHLNRGKEVLLKLAVSVEDYGTAETLPNLEGKQMFLTLRPKTK
jgi:translation initiation factor IF-3